MYGLSQCRRQKSLNHSKAKSYGQKSNSPSKKRLRRRPMTTAMAEVVSSEAHQPAHHTSSLPAPAAVPHCTSSSYRQLPTVSRPPTALTSTFNSFHSSIPAFYSSTADLSSIHGVLPFPLRSANPPLPELPPLPPLHWQTQVTSHPAVSTNSASALTTSSRG